MSSYRAAPPGVRIDEAILQTALDQRKPGQGIAGTKRKEPDRPVILSGVFEGQTTGTPIAVLIENKDARSTAYHKIANLFRPGHGDFTYQAKYGIRDYRGGGRASARETAARVAAGAVAQCVLDLHQIQIVAYTLELGGIRAEQTDDLSQKNTNELQCPDLEAVRKMKQRITDVKKAGDSLGGVVEIVASNVPKGLGEPVFDKLDAEIAKALMSIGAVKAVEIGAGVDAGRMTGYENNDQILPTGFETNHSGGILAGISNGDDIIARAHIKPIPSILKPQKTIDTNYHPTEISTEGRHDICAIPRINKVCEAMMAIVLTDHLLRQKTLGRTQK